MEKTYARFLSPVSKVDNSKTVIYVGGLSLQYVEYDEETTKRLLLEASKYEVCNYIVYSHENDVYNTSEKSENRYGVEVPKLASISSMVYSTDEPQVDCLVIGGQFVGVVVYVEEVGGNGWNNYRNYNYAILYTDGTIVGNNTASYCYSGEDSSRDDSRTYTLHKIK